MRGCNVPLTVSAGSEDVLVADVPKVVSVVDLCSNADAELECVPHLG